MICILLCAVGAQAQQTYDLVVYGATASGVMTAIAGARMGLRTVLLEPRANVGGMATGGLSRTDIGKSEVIGGLALEFYNRVGGRYQQPRSWYYEPRVGESVMREMLQQAGVTVLFHRRLNQAPDFRNGPPTITAIHLDNGEQIRGKIFADCTYEGDLMAKSNVRYVWGRESTATYGEDLAGVRDRTPFHQFQVDIPARDAHRKLLPEISSEPRGESGQPDLRVQAYNFRIIATIDPANRLPWPRPRNYNPKRYELLALLLRAMEEKLGRPQTLGEVVSIGPIPNHKADFNNNGPFSTDYIGKNYDYPEASYKRREAIWQDHAEYVKGFFYFLAHDPRVPPSLQKEVNEWGLSKDEFEATGHWPNQLYIREARRMIGQYVMSQKDLQTDRTKPDAIGMGSYNSDSHNVQRFVNQRGFVENEGDMQVPVSPYQIPYRMIVGDVTNLLVPVCFSASHVAYSSLRMEPQYMIVGHAAGVAAYLAVRDHKRVQDVDVKELQKILKSQGAVF